MKPVQDYRWLIPGTAGNYDSLEMQECITQLASDLNIPPLLSRLLLMREITTPAQALQFFNPSLDQLHDPYLMLNMEKAVMRIVQAMRQEEKVLVYGDYDVDGTSGTAILHSFFSSLGLSSDYYIPDRIKEGYGISSSGIEYARQNGVSLIIAVDCGTTALQQVDDAKAMGIDFLICDHHEVGGPLPKAFAILNPHQPTCPYPFKELCGAGVAFKFLQGMLKQREIQKRFKGDPKETLYTYLDFVALATAADIVPVLGENRILLKFGLDRINTNTRPGLRALIETAGIKPGTMTASKIIFIMAPRINAVGRVGDAKRAVRLMTSELYEEALRMAWVCEQENRERKKIDENTLNDAKNIIEKYFVDETEPVIILHNDNWHPGVLGIVASRLTERYHRPSIIMTTIDGIAKGSARSISGFDLYQVLKECEHTLLQFGGHKYAAGLTVELERINEFKESFIKASRTQLTEEMLIPTIKIDAEITLKELTPAFFEYLNRFEPFGPHNNRPVFTLRQVEINGRPRIFGNNHLSLKIRNNGAIFDAVGFNLGDLASRMLAPVKSIDMAFYIDKYDQNGVTYPQLRIKDLKANT